MKDHVEIGHLTKYDAFRMNRDQDSNFEKASPKTIYIKFSYNARSDWLKQRPLSENKVQVNDIKLAFLLRNFDKFDPN